MMVRMVMAFGRFLLWFRYRIRATGLDEVRAKGDTGILFLPNHPALLDPVIMLTTLWKRFRPRALGDQDQVDRFFIRTATQKMGVLEIPDLAKPGTAAVH